MANAQSRRNFIGKLSASIAGSVAIAKLGFATNTNNTIIPMVIEVKAMGFLWDTFDPFLFCAHHEDYFPKGDAVMGPLTGKAGRQLGDDFIIKDGYRMYHGQTVPGFPGHPHRGFETVTIVRRGMVDHSDSLGASGRYGDGDVQWMTAGKGVQHAEMFPLIHTDKENPLELFQVWLNLPAKDKMVEPHFKMLWGKQIPKFTTKDAASKETYIEVMAGKLLEHTAPAPPPGSWAANPANEVMILTIKMQAGATFTLPKATEGVNRTLYFYEGDSLQVADTTLTNYQQAKVLAHKDVPLVAGVNGASILILQGKPIGEPVMQYGPFVMNTKEEIQQAFNDYQATQFGGWPWAKLDNVHDRNVPRFAKHANGKYEAGV